ncbi:ethanolamine permease [Spirosoma utsteinense]|uniref:Ethanolamine permease n=1 Tax=Spirosoma utsteinense TaxID=2585773 RepID=A0ABR6W6U9_9BACT|nr:ethanolamine permease [Spirosoma utsteinense]MBC3786252.1 ethanolamine permease [Spirosoma utsteinense]MBC3791878.1 ethanolamine permease [Spirosoma utsteinense]
MGEPPNGPSRSIQAGNANDPVQPGLRKVISTTQLWAIAVGMVISGEYFGWNYGWAVAGTIGFLIATLLVTVLYLTFIFSYTELTTAIPDAGGPFAYAFRAFGSTGGFLAGFATLVDFLMAPPAIAAALGAYAHFLNPALPVLGVAIASYVVFIGINLLGVKESANFSVIVTALSVVELVVFMALVAPAYKTENVLAHNESFGIGGIFAALPFAIWFYLAIEGVAMVAEEVKDPHKTIPRGYLLSIGTLVVLALGTMLLCAGAGDWRQLSQLDYPLPETLVMVFGRQNSWAKVFAGLGLFGLIASFHANTLGYSRQIFALARAGYLPHFLATVNRRFQTPHWSLIVGGLVGLAALFSGTTGEIITLSVIGALCMYIMSLLSLFRLRKTEPAMIRTYSTPFYPVVPLIALSLSILCLLAIIYYNPVLSLIFSGLLLLSWVLFKRFAPHLNRRSSGTVVN